MRLIDKLHYDAGENQARQDIQFGIKTLAELRAAFENGQCGDSYDQGYNSVLADAERRAGVKADE